MELTKGGIENFFSGYKTLEFQILKLEYEMYNLDQYGINAINYDSIKSSPTNQINRPVETQAISAIEIKTNYEKEINRYKKQILLIDKALELLPEFQRLLIIKKVIERKPYFTVCAELHISESYAKKVKRKAINNLFLLFSMNQNVENF